MELGSRDEQGYERIKVSRLLLHKGYTKLEPAGDSREVLPARKRTGDEIAEKYQPHPQPQRRRRWRFRVRPKVRVLYSTISRLVRRLRDSYAQLLFVLAAKARETSLLPVVGGSGNKPSTFFRSGSSKRVKGGSGHDLNDVEVKYLDYVKRCVADGELAYYTISLRNTGILF